MSTPKIIPSKTIIWANKIFTIAGGQQKFFQEYKSRLLNGDSDYYNVQSWDMVPYQFLKNDDEIFNLYYEYHQKIASCISFCCSRLFINIYDFVESRFCGVLEYSMTDVVDVFCGNVPPKVELSPDGIYAHFIKSFVYAGIDAVGLLVATSSLPVNEKKA